MRNGVYDTAANSDVSSFLDSVDCPMFVVSLDETLIYWNQQMEEATSIASSDVCCQLALAEVFPSVSKDFRSILKSILLGERKQARAYLKTNPENGRVWPLRILSRRSSLGEVTGALCMVDEVTDPLLDCWCKKEGDSDASCGVIFRSTSQNECDRFDRAGIIVFKIECNEELSIKSYNKLAQRLLGCSGKDLLGTPFIQNVVKLSMQASVAEVLRTALQGKIIQSFVFDAVCRSGETRILLSSMSLEYGMDSCVSGVTIVALDLTEQSKHDRAAASMAGELQQLIDCANIPIFGVDCEG